MTTDRPYRPALVHQAAVAQLEAGAGTQFHPTTCAALVSDIQTGSVATIATVDPTKPVAPTWSGRHAKQPRRKLGSAQRTSDHPA